MRKKIRFKIVGAKEFQTQLFAIRDLEKKVVTFDAHDRLDLAILLRNGFEDETIDPNVVEWRRA